MASMIKDEARLAPLMGLLETAMIEAIGAEADFRMAAAVLDDARNAITSSLSIAAAADEITALAAMQPETSPLPSILIKFRNSWLAKAMSAWSDQVVAVTSTDPNSAYKIWHGAVADAVAQFRFDLAAQFAAVTIPSPENGSPAPALIEAWAVYADLGRWREARPLLQYLGSDSTSERLARARALSILSEIETLIRSDHDSARAACDAAERLAPGDWRSAFARARIAVEVDERQTAEQSFEQAAEAGPTIGAIRAEWARFRAKTGDLAGAQAILAGATGRIISPMEIIGAQLTLYAYSELFTIGVERIEGLVNRFRLIADKPEHVWSAMVAAAEAFEANGDPKKAHVWYSRAEKAEPQSIGPAISHGYLYLAEQNFAEARNCFGRVRLIAPGAVEGYWAMANLAARTQDWQALLLSTQHTLELAPDWYSSVATLLRTTAETVLDLCEETVARRFYDEVRALLGAEYEARYRNLLGHLAYKNGKYSAAAAEYRNAIAAKPNARYYGNLALALEQLHLGDHSGDDVLTESIAAAKRATEIDSNDPEYSATLERLEKLQAYLSRHGQPATTLVPDHTRLRIRIHGGLVAALVDWDAEGKSRLSGTCTRRLEALRQKIRQECLFTLCTVRLSDLNTDFAKRDHWYLEAGTAVVDSGQVDTLASGDALMDVFEAAILRHLPLFLGHAEAREIAKTLSLPTGELGAEALTALARSAREILVRDGRISIPEHAERLRDAIGTQSGVRRLAEARPDVERIFITTAPDGPNSKTVFEELQAAVYAATGVVVPRLFPHSDPALTPYAWKVEVDPPVFASPAISNDSPIDQIDTILVTVSFRLLGMVALRWQLERVREAEPDLVEATLAVMNEGTLLERLRALVQSGHSILCLRQALEHLVLDSPPPDLMRALYSRSPDDFTC